ncbi:hypothetical protein [Bacteroides cellulosilyticus]|uniref:hypothetical protein n=1 Tax=Bacteroides cellulosilyticus TaxID=246787 RepID=UPI001C37A024|nr:hypothetical protein [Bacteroides cellulosilyticus]MBV3637530.1 hypothetical protein [Bacteroides cellulosilyticus]MBV3663871.1 hypothetical protein [Bacteroides cellulosilyticus]MBV3687082.1 hypothetical protein [Bacteroides cellulosilyticus]MBV3694544.1 hypothetical protein [Bacteroides cellulosilyticus]MBV3708070.1 hypothetical protein [Bacteroides cellulosilyticus]
MDLRRTLLLFSFIFAGSLAIAQPKDRWTIQDDGAIRWNINDNIPHDDHLEMSGQQLSVVLRYGVDAQKRFHLNRSLVFPMLRMHPNKTQNNLKQRFDVNIPALVTVDDQTLLNEEVRDVTFNGIMRVESSFGYVYRRKELKDAVQLTRVLYPSTNAARYCEEYTFKNSSPNQITLRVPEWNVTYTTPEEAGVYGAYCIEAALSKSGVFVLKPGETLEFYAIFSGRKLADASSGRNNAGLSHINILSERAAREALISQWWGNLVLETPDPVLNRMFAFAKLRGAESIYRTKGGLMHGPGGEAYYAAVWANDQAEYINPFFPFLGYEIGDESALNSFRHFARYMNPEYKPIPSSIISEGVSFWHGAKDRGDGAMIAYGAARYALARGDKAEALELWPLIEWCLEYCNRKLTPAGVVASNSDELENRFPAGDANLCTSTLYYDALRSAVMLGRELGVSAKQLNTYRDQADALEKAIEKHFGYEIEGFHSYRYYEGNDILRSWICMPLVMGIYTRAQGTIDALFSPRLWTDDGLLTQAGTETFWDRSTLYALRGTIAAGEVEKGMSFLKKYSHRRLLGDHVPYAIEAWPEGDQRHLSAESGLYCRIYTEGLFGIRPTGLRSFEMTPRLPQEWEYMNLNCVRAFNSEFDIRVSRAGKKLHVEVLKGGKPILRKNVTEGVAVRVNL